MAYRRHFRVFSDGPFRRFGPAYQSLKSHDVRNTTIDIYYSINYIY